MSEYRVVQDYPDAPERVWRALTDPEIVPLWTSTGQGGKPVGFAAVVGTRFKGTRVADDQLSYGR
jgi:uncharacterized protein YndB with AHSA1/START domain